MVKEQVTSLAHDLSQRLSGNDCCQCVGHVLIPIRGNMHPIDVDVFIAVIDLAEVVEVQISLGSRLTDQWRPGNPRQNSLFEQGPQGTFWRLNSGGEEAGLCLEHSMNRLFKWWLSLQGSERAVGFRFL